MLQDLEALYSILTELERVNQCLAFTAGNDHDNGNVNNEAYCLFTIYKKNPYK